VKLGRDACKGRVELSAEAVNDRDDCDRDASRDEAIPAETLRQMATRFATGQGQLANLVREQ